jgi:hypothetical protein
MRCRITVALLLAAAAMRAQAPGEGEPAGLLEQARATALNYAKWLPDFICDEVIQRFEAYGPAGGFRHTDSLTLQVTYFQMRESYKLVARNGRPTRQKLESVGGASSQGEFGSTLLLIFHPMSKAQLAFKEWKVTGGRRVAVYTYIVERANSRFELRMAATSVMAGYHGEVAIDPATHLVVRIEEEIDVPAGFPVQYSRNAGEYEFKDVGGHPYLLPVRWESWAADIVYKRRFPGTKELVIDPVAQKRYHNVIEFKDYRKYAAESTLSFGVPDEPVKK